MGVFAVWGLGLGAKVTIWDDAPDGHLELWYLRGSVVLLELLGAWEVYGCLALDSEGCDNRCFDPDK